MALAFKLRKQNGGKGVALLVAPDGNMYSATDESTAFPGHTAVVNLVQHLYLKGPARDALTNAMVYCTYKPSSADQGMFIEHVKQGGKNGEVRLFFPEGNALSEARPTKLVKPSLNKKGDHPLPEEFPSWDTIWKDFKGVNLEQVAVVSGSESTVAKMQTDRKSLPGKVTQYPSIVTYDMGTQDSAPAFTSDIPPGVLAYATLQQAAQELFDAIFMLAAYSLASPIHAPLKTTNHKAKVGAVLVSPRGQILSWGVDYDYALHAETTTVKLFQKRYNNAQLPKGSRLYTSLEPCFMCSGLLDSAYRDSEEFVVICGQDDPAVHQQAPTFLKPDSGTTVSEIPSTTQYGQRNMSFKARIDGKVKDMAQWESKAKSKFEKSVMNQMDLESFNRRHAKATLQLAGLGERIASLGQTEKDFLKVAWMNGLGVACVFADVLPEELLRKTGEYLDATRGQNTHRAEKQPEYKQRATQRKGTTLYETKVKELLQTKPDLGL